MFLLNRAIRRNQERMRLSRRAEQVHIVHDAYAGQGKNWKRRKALCLCIEFHDLLAYLIKPAHSASGIMINCALHFKHR